MMKPIWAALAATAMLSAGAAHAGPAGDLVRTALYSGDLAKGLDVLTPLAASDQEAQFGVGLIELTMGIESLAQSLYRHGLAAPDGGPMGPTMMLPVPLNPNPEPLDYAGVRQILQTLVDDLDRARMELDKAGASGDYVVRIDPLKIRIDINGDGRVDDAESVAGAIAQMLGTPPDQLKPIIEPRADNSGKTGGPTPEEGFSGIGFDRADAYWLAGYTEVLAVQADFLLAHDFSSFVDAVFHRLFPKAGFPMQAYAAGGMLMLDPQTDVAVADLVAAIHTIDWPVIEQERLKGVLTRLHDVTAHSRLDWQAILAETDDDHELVPSPRQTSQVPDGAVTEAMVDAWMNTLDTADEILDGKLLVPHWRFKQGFDLKAYFETATRTDLVMLLTGYGALPYIKDGPVASVDAFRAANDAFGERFIGYAFWFN